LKTNRLTEKLKYSRQKEVNNESEFFLAISEFAVSMVGIYGNIYGFSKNLPSAVASTITKRTGGKTEILSAED